MAERQKTGELGEKLAINFLKKKGYKIIETNYRCRFGEIDIVCRHKNNLVFVEVRTKVNLDFGSPEESITGKKMRHMVLSAEYYLQNHEKMPEFWRIDLVAIELDGFNNPRRIELIENAVEG